MLILSAASNKYLDDLPVISATVSNRSCILFIETNYSGLLKSLREKKAFDDTNRAEAKKALDASKSGSRPPSDRSSGSDPGKIVPFHAHTSRL